MFIVTLAVNEFLEKKSEGAHAPFKRKEATYKGWVSGHLVYLLVRYQLLVYPNLVFGELVTNLLLTSYCCITVIA